MSFYLVNQPLNSKVQVQKIPIVFISLFEIKSISRVLATINSNSILTLYDLNRGQVLLQVRLILNKQALSPLLKSGVCRNLIVLQTNKSFYFVNLQEQMRQVENLQNVGEVQVKNLRIIMKSKDVTQSWLSLLNKEIKMINKGEKILMKMGGRNKNVFKYCFGVFDHQNYEFKIDHQWQGQFTYQYSMNIESLSNNFTIYQTYIHKGKPIKLSIGNCISQYDQKDQFLLSETEIIHFYEQITIIGIALLNDQIICIFGNNSFEDVSSSLMIVYNIREKYTLNYLKFKEVFLQKVYQFMHPRYQFHYKHSLVYFDAIELGQKSSLLYQLYPNSYQTDQSFKLKGKIIEVNKGYIFTRMQDELFIYPKLHKAAIYYKWMNELGVYDLQCLTMIAQFLQ